VRADVVLFRDRAGTRTIVVVHLVDGTLKRLGRLPCLVIRARCTLVSDSRCRGVIAAQEHRCSGRLKRFTSLSSATGYGREYRPHPRGMAWIA
jgi:hypothetical protein